MVWSARAQSLLGGFAVASVDAAPSAMAGRSLRRWARAPGRGRPGPRTVGRRSGDFRCCVEGPVFKACPSWVVRVGFVLQKRWACYAHTRVGGKGVSPCTQVG